MTWPPCTRRRPRNEAGAVSAEAAVALPALAAVVVVLCALLGAVGAQARCADAARAAARQAARSATEADVAGTARAVAGDPRAVVDTVVEGDRVLVTVRVRARGLPSWAGGGWVSGTAVARREPGSWPS